MRFLSHTERDIQEMLAAIGLESVDQLFDALPDSLRLKAPLDLPAGLDEQRLMQHVEELASMNTACELQACFLGAGVYDHYTPQLVGQVLSRSEFLTSYTPYQPELAQGTLKAIFEFQTMISEILDMDIANASMYDGAHALAEALLMALRVKRRAKKVLLSQGAHPESREVAATYLRELPEELIEVPLTAEGLTDYDAISDESLEGAAMLMVQSPNFYGRVEDLAKARAFCDEKGLLLGVAFNEPLAYGLFQAPGEAGADIAAGECQSLGIPPSFGGPSSWCLGDEKSPYACHTRALGIAHNRQRGPRELRADFGHPGAAYSACPRDLQYLHQPGLDGLGDDHLSQPPRQGRLSRVGADQLRSGRIPQGQADRNRGRELGLPLGQTSMNLRSSSPFLPATWGNGWRKGVWSRGYDLGRVDPGPSQAAAGRGHRAQPT